jgi:CubicO group peptidase (beta-lactamase class C family)
MVLSCRPVTRFLLLLLAVAPRPVSAATPPSEAHRLGAAIDAYAKPLVAHGDLSGQLLVARRGAILVERNYGYANWELRSPMTADTRIDIMSVTKPMTGTIAIQLLQENKFAVHDSIARWFPDFPKGNRITVEQLMRHRSGIPHELVPDSESTQPRTAAEMVEIAKRRPLDFEPGSKSSYSSGGYSVLARVLELVAGMSYDQLLSERIFTPLGMTHSTEHDARRLLPGRASAVVPGPSGNENAAYQDFSGIIGAGSVWSTARDLHRFVQGVVASKLGQGVQYSFLNGGKIDFNGQGAGFRSFCDYDSATGLEVIFLGNLHTGAPDLLRGAIPRLAAGQAVTPASLPKTTDRAADEMGRAVGTYQLGNGTKLVVRVKDGALWANDWVLLPEADGAYFSPRDYGVVQLVPSSGKVERLDWEQRGEKYPAPRIAD